MYRFLSRIFTIFVTTVPVTHTVRTAYQHRSFTNPHVSLLTSRDCMGFLLPKYISAILTIIWYISIRRTNILRFSCHVYVLNLWQTNGKFPTMSSLFTKKHDIFQPIPLLYFEFSAYTLTLPLITSYQPLITIS